jgi:hypothetical protein
MKKVGEAVIDHLVFSYNKNLRHRPNDRPVLQGQEIARHVLRAAHLARQQHQALS